MDKVIVRYQKAYNKIIEALKESPDILAVMVSGSMVSGDLWEESDIDLLAIEKGYTYGLKNIYTQEFEVPIHIKLISKEAFLKEWEISSKGASYSPLLSSTKLAYSKDSEINEIYNQGIYLSDMDRERWCLVYLGSLLKSMGVFRKYLGQDKLYTAYPIAVRSIEDYSRLLVNVSGYVVNRDTLALAMDLDNDFKKLVDRVYFSFRDKEALEELIDFLDKKIREILKNCTTLILEFIRSKDRFLSSEDIRNHRIFKDFDISMEEILKLLYNEGYVKKQQRDYKGESGYVILKENVYYI